MMRTGRILLIEPEDGFRRDLDRELERAGHDVAAVPDESAAERLIQEGLDPDVVVAEGEDPDPSPLLALAPHAVHLRIDRALDRTREFESPVGRIARCAADPGDVLRRVEEVLLRHQPPGGADEGSRCLDLARRLANALPRVHRAEDRIDLVTEAFDTFFGVLGTLVVRRGPGPDDWIDASQGIASSVARRISEEITRRSGHRDIRPFLARLEVDGHLHDVACLAVRIGEEEIDLALELARAPQTTGQREALMNLIGSAVRASSSSEELNRLRALLVAQSSSFDSLLEMARDFTTLTTRASLCERILTTLRRDLLLDRSALFLPRAGTSLLELAALSGFDGARLERIGLSSRHGVGAMCLRSTEVRRLVEIDPEGMALHEQDILEEANLQWVVPLPIDETRTGLLFFGGRDERSELQAWQQQLLQALLGSAAVALRILGRIEELTALSAGRLRGLVAAAELRDPADRGHADRVARTAVRVGRALGMTEPDLRDLSFAALLHDVGKLAIGGANGRPESDPERAARLHPGLGSTIVSLAKHSDAVIQGVEQHHERFDGEGFPHGLRGESIHLYGRILAIADTWDRLVHAPESRLSDREAVKRLERAAGLLFDPGIVAVFAAEVARGLSPPTADEQAWFEEMMGTDVPD